MREAIISTVIAAGGSVWASYSKGFMDEMEAGANERGQRTAKQLLIATDTLPGKLKWTLSGFLGKYYNSLIDSHCELKTEGFNVGLPVLDLEEVFVPFQGGVPEGRGGSSGCLATVPEEPTPGPSREGKIQLQLPDSANSTANGEISPCNTHAPQKRGLDNGQSPSS
jgi:hypothetical protein